MKKKALLLVLAAVVLVIGSVAGTLAYLTATSGTVTNTFTVGAVGLDLWEHQLNSGGTLGTNKVTKNTYHLVPGGTYLKDPTVVVKGKSEPCVVFVRVENGLSAILDGFTLNNGWVQPDAAHSDLYKYSTVVQKADTDQELVVFGNFKVLKNVTDLSNYSSAEIKVTAFAIQSQNVDDATALSEAIAKLYPSGT